MEGAVIVTTVTLSPGAVENGMGDVMCHPITFLGHLFMGRFLPVLSYSQEPNRTVLERERFLIGTFMYYLIVAIMVYLFSIIVLVAVLLNFLQPYGL